MAGCATVIARVRFLSGDESEGRVKGVRSPTYSFSTAFAPPNLLPGSLERMDGHFAQDVSAQQFTQRS
jgi:hypothetical protein